MKCFTQISQRQSIDKAAAYQNLMSRRGLMARVSLFCVVAGGRPLLCGGFTLVWKGMGIAAPTTLPKKLGGWKAGEFSICTGRPFTSMKLGDHRIGTHSQRGWRKGSHVRRAMTISELEQKQQPEATAIERAGGAGEKRLAALDGTTTPSHTAQKFKPNSKRLLTIPRDEWPR